MERQPRKLCPSTQAQAAVLAAFAEEVFGKKDFSQLDRFVRADYIQHNPLVAQGSAGFRQFFEAWFKASPDFRHEVKQIAVDGDRVWVFGAYSGTHAGDWLGLPATGRAYSFDMLHQRARRAVRISRLIHTSHRRKQNAPGFLPGRFP